jgi:hypothetical protein
MGEREPEGSRLGVPAGRLAGWLRRILMHPQVWCVRASAYAHECVPMCVCVCVGASGRAGVCVWGGGGGGKPCPIGHTAGFARLFPSHGTGKCDTGRDKPKYERQGLRCVGQHMHEPGEGGGRRQARTSWHPPSRVWCFIQEQGACLPNQGGESHPTSVLRKRGHKQMQYRLRVMMAK